MAVTNWNLAQSSCNTNKTGCAAIINYHDAKMAGIGMQTIFNNSPAGSWSIPSFPTVNSIVVKNECYGIGGGSLFGCGCYGAGSVLGARTFNALENKNETDILNDVGFWDRQYANIINTCSTTEGTLGLLGIGANFLGNLLGGGDKAAAGNNQGNAKV